MPNPMAETVEALWVVWDYDRCERRIENVNQKSDVLWV